MRFLLNVSLAVALIAHALLGCCAHHAHAGHVENAAHEHGDHDDEGGNGESPCRESKCVFASGAARLVIDSPLASDFAAAELITSEATIGVRMAAADRFERPGGLALCILHRRLLI